MTDLTDLIARVEKLEGPDREVDDLIAVRVARMKPTTTYGHEVLGNLREAPNRSPLYTASLDAALALVERVLPGWGGMVDFGALMCGAAVHSADLWSPVREVGETEDGFPVDIRDEARGEAKTPALALILTLLRALQASEKQS